MTDPGQAALDGRAVGDVPVAGGNTIHDGQELPWRPCELYRRVSDSRDRDARRGRGTIGPVAGGPKPGQPWRTTSTLDEATVLGEELTKVYVEPDAPEGDPGWTLHDMVLELFKDMRARQKAAGQ